MCVVVTHPSISRSACGLFTLTIIVTSSHSHSYTRHRRLPLGIPTLGKDVGWVVCRFAQLGILYEGTISGRTPSNTCCLLPQCLQVVVQLFHAACQSVWGH